MVTQEQHMSEAKREHSRYHHSVGSGRDGARIKPTRSQIPLELTTGELRLLDSWEQQAGSGDPYNGIGARIGKVFGPRK
jgi:hypothetical protein